MAFEQRDNTGTLFKNNRKEKDTHPDYDGTCLIDGVEYYMNAWIKDGAKGKFMSFSFKPKQAQQGKSAPRQMANDRALAKVVNGGFDDDSEVPF